jgi:tetratricopeptide (TPR) repeat protein
MEIEKDLLQLLMETGHLASGYGYFPEAEVIFSGLRAVRPESEYPLIGLALAKMNARKYIEAIKILMEEALKVNPKSDLAKSFLGLALKLSGLREESVTVLREVIAADRDKIAVKIARNLITEQTG